MPEKEFDVLYRMRSAYLQGVFDHNKEILLPCKKNGVDGYNVITPFYYFDQATYDGLNLAVGPDGSPAHKYNVERGGMAVHRGW